MAVITRGSVSTATVPHTPAVDLIGTDRPERRPLPAWFTRLPRWLRAGGLLVAALVAGAALLAWTAPDDADPDQLAVLLVGTGVSTDGLTAQGPVTVELANEQDAPLRLGALAVVATGLEGGPVQVGVLAPFERRRVELEVVVADCASLEQPVVVQLTAGGDAGPRQLPIADRSGRGLRPCTPVQFRDPYDQPVSPPDLAARGTGGSATRSGAGVRGTLELEVRNAGTPLRLLSVTAEVPGVRFRPLVPANGVSLRTDDRVPLALGYDIRDCGDVRREGRLLLVVRQPGGEPVDVPLPVRDAGGGTGAGALDRVLEACSE